METIKRFDKKLLIGTILMIIGGVLLFDNYFNLHLRHIVLSWPMILIIAGIISLLNSRVLTPGLVLISIGLIFLLPRFDFWPYYISFRELFFPVVLIGIGIIMISNRGQYKKKINNFGSKDNGTINEGYFEDTNIFSGGKKIVSSKNFKGATLTTIFGGAEYNFMHADIVDGKAELDVTAVFGGSKLIIPSDWKVITDVSAIFGGFSDERGGNAVDQNNDKVLYIKGSVVFGGGEIVSY